MTTPTLHIDTPALSLVCAGACAVVRCIQVPSVDTTRRVEAILASGAKSHGALHLFVQLEPSVPMPREDQRTELAALLARTAPRVASWVVLVTGQGFWSSAMRSLMTALARDARLTSAIHVDNDAARAAAWFSRTAGVSEAAVWDALSAFESDADALDDASELVVSSA